MAYSYRSYEENDDVKKARALLAQTEAAKPGEYQSAYQQQIKQSMDGIINRPKFQYDLGKDALYKQYKDQAVRQGKMAMMDTMGQAAAMTGGYGSSYGQSVGQQAYQGYLQGLNDKVPELYKLAMDKYSMEGSDMLQKYGLLTDAEGRDYSRYQDSLGNWRNDLQYASGRFDTERDVDLTKYYNDRSYDWNVYTNDQKLAIQEAEYFLSTGRDVPADVLARAGLSSAYAGAKASDVRAALAAAQAEAESAGGGGGGGPRKGTVNPVMEAAQVAAAAGTDKAAEYIAAMQLTGAQKAAAEANARGAAQTEYYKKKYG